MPQWYPRSYKFARGGQIVPNHLRKGMPLGLRETLQRNQGAVAVAAVLVIVGCVVWISTGGRGKGVSKEIYFYDIGTKKLFAVDRKSQPPIDAASGAGNGVKAVVYSCGACDAAGIRIAYLSTYDAAASAALKKLEAGGEGTADAELMSVIDQGTLVAAPPTGDGALKWLPVNSEEGIAVMGQVTGACGASPPNPCFP